MRGFFFFFFCFFFVFFCFFCCNATTGRQLLGFDEGDVREEEAASLHPMGVGERVGDNRFPWIETDTLKLNSRSLLDTYGDSLKHVNALYNKKFGSESRKVISYYYYFFIFFVFLLFRFRLICLISFRKTCWSV
jgi:hypothetical protein